MSKPEGGKEENDSRGHVFSSSEPVPSDIPIVRGCSFSTETTADDVLSSYATTGFQATHFARACAEVERMLSWRLRDTDDKERELLGVRVKKSGDQDGAGAEDGDDDVDGAFTEDELSRIGCRIFLGYTSNMVSSGVRETVRYLAERRFVDVIVSSAGGIEEDFIKCLAPCFVGSFDFAPGPVMRRKGLNRTGNLVVPNDNYCLFEDWLNPILDAMLEEQNDPESPVNWTPSKMIARLGKEIGKLPNCEESVYYWCYKNGIPVFSPAITDGSIGDVVYFHSIRNPGLRIDIAEDIRRINDLAVRARRTGQIILGGGLIKHHVQNANLMRNGSHYSVFVNTGQEFDGSDSGAKPDEALSWGKIHISAKPVKVCADASLVFPLLVQQVFVKWDRENGAVGEDGVRRGRGDITT